MSDGSDVGFADDSSRQDAKGRQERQGSLRTAAGGAKEELTQRREGAKGLCQVEISERSNDPWRLCAFA